MKHFIKISILALAILNSINTVFSLDTAAAKFMPIQTGNYWVYTFTEHPSEYSYTFRWKITGSTVSNNHLYYYLDEYGAASLFTSLIRFDSTTGSLKKYSTSSCPWLLNEINMDSLSSRYNDSSIYNCDIHYRCSDTSTINYFNHVFKKKVFYALYDFGSRTRTYAKNIGFVNTEVSGMTGTYSIILRGCVVNGILYGDTSLVGVSQINTEITEKYELSQNYPNPFNPATKIKFDIPVSVETSRRDVLISIYDALGKEVAILVNQQLQPGSYEADWDAAAFPSGVYFYKLKSGKFEETKKMVLIK